MSIRVGLNDEPSSMDTRDFDLAGIMGDHHRRGVAMTNPTIIIDTDKKCAECGKGGAVASGICIACTSKVISNKPMKSAIGRAIQARWRKENKNRNSK